MNLLNGLQKSNISNLVPIKPETSRHRWLFWFLGLGLVMALGAAGVVAYAAWGIFTPLSVIDTSEQKTFLVARGEGVKDIAAHLVEAGYIRRAEFFAFYVYYKKQGTLLQAGEYALRRDMNIPEILAVFVDGRVVPNEITITFPEGYTVKDMDGELSENKLLSPGIFFSVAKNWEGYLFPDTYRFRRDASATSIRDTMLGNFKEKFTDQMKQDAAMLLVKMGLCKSYLSSRSERGDPLQIATSSLLFQNLEETPRNDICQGDAIITLASLIEKEVRTLKDMKIVSGILWRRLQIGMPLQVDATIIYIKENPSTTLHSAQDIIRFRTNDEKPGEITLDDLKIKSSYNTYLNRGLPPGPVSNPGLNAIIAAIYPVESGYLYYLSKPTGETVLSRTLEEHNIAKAKYLR